MSKTRYYHLRNYGSSGVQAKGGVTLAIEASSDMFSDLKMGDTITINAGVAFCHDEDNYNKRIGRDIASGRKTSFDFLVDTESTFKRVVLINDTIKMTIEIVGDKLFVDEVCHRH